MKNISFQSIRKVVFPLILFIFPLVKMAMGAELADTGYSLGNYRFFPEAEGTWVLNTYLSNLTGYLLTLLPFGRLMLGMKFYTSLLVSMTALTGYRFFVTKMPDWIVFLGEMIAIGLCWCPPVILYNYMTYFFFLAGGVLLFRGLAGDRKGGLAAAGVCLGINIFVRNPNILEAALIICVWYYGYLRHKKAGRILRETLFCLGGYVGGVLVMAVVLMLHYGPGAPVDMIRGLFEMAGSDQDYTFVQMLLAIADAYAHGLRWLLYMVICILPGIPFLMIRRDKFPRIRKLLYCMGILFLFFVLQRWGMYNFKYYQKESVLQWAVVFLILSLINMIWMLFTRMTDMQWKLIASMGIVTILITPLGSNNHVWPIINNLFLVAPVTLWTAWRFARWGKRYLGTENNQIPLFPVKAMQMGVIAALLVQSVGVGCFYVFHEGENGEPKTARITDNTVAYGMYTTQDNAHTLEELSRFVEGRPEAAGRELLLFGDIPALSYYLDRHVAISTSWPDLDTNSEQRLEEDLIRLADEKIVVILNAHLTKEQRVSNKKRMIDLYLAENDYREVFRNGQYIVYM